MRRETQSGGLCTNALTKRATAALGTCTGISLKLFGELLPTIVKMFIESVHRRTHTHLKNSKRT